MKKCCAKELRSYQQAVHAASCELIHRDQSMRWFAPMSSVQKELPKMTFPVILRRILCFFKGHRRWRMDSYCCDCGAEANNHYVGWKIR